MSRFARAVRRLRAMDRDEVRVRAISAARKEAGWLAHTLRPPTWQREALAHAIDGAHVPQDVVAGLHAADWMRAHEGLVEHFATRPRRFVVDPQTHHRLVRTMAVNWPQAVGDATRRADALVLGRFDLLGYRDLSFPSADEGAAIDWHLDPVHGCRAPLRYWSRVPFLAPACGDHKIIWELNRHQHWLALGRAWWLSGDPRYREIFVTQLESWMAANPPLTGINWASMLELGLRAISWIWALHFFTAPIAQGQSDSHPWTVDLLLGLDRQLAHVEGNLSTYFSPNTHLLGEALALYVAGRTLPELRGSDRWERVGRDTLVDQAVKQIDADGGHVERSTHYHRYTLDFYLLALAVARATGDPLAPFLAETAGRLAAFARAIADSSGRLPCIGDDDGGMLLPICGRDAADVSDSLALAAHLLCQPDLALGPAPEEVGWMCGEAPHPSVAIEPPRSQALAATGYVVCRSRRGDHLVLDAGSHGYLNGGHAHADALSLTLAVAGTPLLIDPGTGCYTVNPEIRERFRSSRLHNTITLDRRSQSESSGPFHWSATANGALDAWRSNDSFDYVAASHDGYAPLVHYRTVLARPGCWFIVDRIFGSGAHRVDCHWHLDPRWQVQVDGGRVLAEAPGDARVWILSSDGAFEAFSGRHGSTDLGWCAPVYGPLVPTVTLRTTRQVQLPLAMVTAIVESEDPPELDRLPLLEDARNARQSVAFNLRTTEWTDTTLVSPPGGRAASGGPSVQRAGGIETDAALLCRRVRGDSQTTTLLLVDGSMVRDAQGLPLLELPHAVADLAATFHADGAFHFVSSEPINRVGRGIASAATVMARARACRRNW